MAPKPASIAALGSRTPLTLIKFWCCLPGSPNNLDRLFYLAVDAARLENDFALLNKFIVFKERGFTPSYSDALQQKIVKSFKNWITRADSSSDGRMPTVGYTERSLFQLLNNHFKA